MMRPLALAAALVLVANALASAATVTNVWQAKIGPTGANGTAKIVAFGSGTGSIALKLTQLKASTFLAVVLSKGTCSSVGSTVATLAPIETSSTGTATRNSVLTATQVRAINNATKAPGRIAIRIGSGSAAACGLFAVPTPTLFATIAVGVHPENVTIDRTGVWIVNSRDGTLSRIDTKTNSVVLVSPRLRPYSLTPYAVTSGFGSIWVTMLSSIGAGASQNAGFVVRINPATGAAIGSPIPIGPSPLAIAASADAIWVANYDAATVTRIDPTMNKVTTAIPVSERPSGIVAGFGAIWVSNGAGHVVRIDPTTKSVVSTIATQASPTSQPLAAGLAVGAGSVWAVNYGTDNQSDGSVSRIDPSTNSVVATIPGLRNPVQLAFGGGYLWAGMWAPWLVQIDPAANTVKYQVGVGVRLAGGAVASSVSWGVAATDHAVWVVHPYYAGVPADGNLPGVVSRVNF